MIAYIIVAAVYSLMAVCIWKILHFPSVKESVVNPSSPMKMVLSIFWLPAMVMTVIDIVLEGDI